VYNKARLLQAMARLFKAVKYPVPYLFINFTSDNQESTLRM